MIDFKNKRNIVRNTEQMESDCLKMTRFWSILLVLLSFLSPSDSSSSSQVISNSLTDVTSVMGDRLRLNCTVPNRQGSCQWTKNGFGLGTDPDLPGYTRYSLDNSGDHCDLILEPVLPEDEAEYQCQIGPGHQVAGVSSHIVKVRVNHEPGVPHILQTKYAEVLEVVEGEQVKLECESQGGRPVADIVWRHGDGSKVVSEVTDIVTRMEDQRTFRTRSVLKMIPETDEDIYCEASSSAFPAARQSQPVKIRIKNRMHAKLVMSKDVVNVGDSVGVHCAVSNAGNSILSYTWFLNNVEMKHEKQNTITLENVEKQHNNLMIKCLVETSSDAVVAELPLLVKDPMRVEKSGERILASPGEEVDLHCNVAGGDKDDISYVWTHESDNKLIGVGKNIKVKMTEQLTGHLVCTAISGPETVSTRVEVVMKQKPRVIISGDRIQYSSLESSVVLSCGVENHDENTVVTWSAGDKSIAQDDANYKLVQHRDDIMKHDLVITSVQEEDFTKYRCKAVNNLGDDEDEMELRNEADSYLIVSVVLNIVGVIGVAGFIFFYIYIRRRNSMKNVEYMEKEKKRYLNNQSIFKHWDTGVFDKLLSVKNQNFNVDQEFNYDAEDLNESSHLNLTRPNKRVQRFYSAPNGSFHSDNTMISYVNDEEN